MQRDDRASRVTMFEGFSDYGAFADSIADGFTNQVNHLVPKSKKELLCNVDGYSALCAGFGDELTTKKIRAVTDEHIKKIQEELEFGCGVTVSKEQVLECLRGALNQSVGFADLD